jgi:hypothetical protein
MIRARGRYSLDRCTFRCSLEGTESRAKARGVAAACIFRCGALACRDPLSRSEDRSRSMFTLRRPCPALVTAEATLAGIFTGRGTRLCFIPKGWPRSVLAFQRSRRARLHDARARARLSTLALTPALGSLPSSAPTLSRETSLGVLLARSRPRRLGRAHHCHVYRYTPFDAFRATLHRLTVHGLASSCHVSTKAGVDLLPFEDRARSSHPAIAPALAFRR